MKRFFVTDIHGSFRGFRDAIIKSNISYNDDLLICGGDSVDYNIDTPKVFDELLKFKNLIYILGNHDQWFLEWCNSPDDVSTDFCWTGQGGYQTIESYNNKKSNVPTEHINLLKNASNYYITDDNILFTHAGFDPDFDLDQNTSFDFLWDRNLVYDAHHKYKEGLDFKLTKYKEVFLGHTPTQVFDIDKPTKFGDIWLCDTCAKLKNGMVSIIDVDTKEIFQSETNKILYGF